MEATEVCAIIRACGKAGVSRLKISDLEIEFGFQQTLPIIGSDRNLDLSKNEVTDNVTDAGKALSTETQMEPLDEKALRELALVDAAISNPMVYEQMMMDGDLEGEAAEAIRSQSDVQRG